MPLSEKCCLVKKVWEPQTCTHRGSRVKEGREEGQQTLYSWHAAATTAATMTTPTQLPRQQFTVTTRQHVSEFKLDCSS